MSLITYKIFAKIFVYLGVGFLQKLFINLGIGRPCASDPADFGGDQGRRPNLRHLRQCASLPAHTARNGRDGHDGEGRVRFDLPGHGL